MGREVGSGNSLAGQRPLLGTTLLLVRVTHDFYPTHQGLAFPPAGLPRQCGRWSESSQGPFHPAPGPEAFGTRQGHPSILGMRSIPGPGDMVIPDKHSL